MMRLADNRRSPLFFANSLMCLGALETFPSEHEVTNKVTFLALHTVHGLLLKCQVSILAASEDFTYSNSLLEILSANSVQCIL